MYGEGKTAPQAAWEAFAASGKIADYLSYVRCAVQEERPEKGKHADKNQGTGAQTPEYR